MLRFLDRNNIPLPTQYTIHCFVSGKVLPVRFEARNGWFLTATVPVGVTAEAKETSETEWTNLAEGPLDLAPYAPGMVDVDLRVRQAAAGTDDIAFEITETP